jgi:phosphatidylinositol alpha-1,6-mannosyltransferase
MLALVTDAFGGRGGIAQYNRDLLSSLAQSGVVSSITVLPRHAPDQAIVSSGILQTPPRTGRIAYALMALAAAFTRQIDVVFCGHLYMGPLAALIARLKGAKLIAQTHGVEAWPRASWLQRVALESADLVLCVSRHTRAAVLAWAAIVPERVVVLPNTVGETFTPGNGSALRAELGLEGKRVLLTVGRIDSRERYKGHDRVINALPGLVAQGYDVIYVVVGEGDDRIRLERLARAAGVGERVLFMGELGNQRLIEAYRMADLFVMPSTGEGFGIAFLEAMASGTPALGLAVGGARDALADGELGAATSEGELVATLTRLLSAPKCDPQELSSTVRARFGRNAFTERVGIAVTQVLHSARASSQPSRARLRGCEYS